MKPRSRWARPAVPSVVRIRLVAAVPRVGQVVPPDHGLGGFRARRADVGLMIVGVDDEELPVPRSARLHERFVGPEPAQPVVVGAVLHHHDHDRVDRRIAGGTLEQRGPVLVAEREHGATPRQRSQRGQCASGDARALQELPPIDAHSGSSREVHHCAVSGRRVWSGCLRCIDGPHRPLGRPPSSWTTTARSASRTPVS